MPILKPLPPPWDRFVPFVEKLTVWTAFFVLLWFLRPFFFLVFLTFLFGYVLEHIVEALEGRIHSRRARVILGFVLVLSVLVGIGFVVAPELGRQAAAFPAEIKKHAEAVDHAITKFRAEHESLNDVIPEDFRARDIASEVFAISSSSDATAATTGHDTSSGDDPSSLLRSIIPPALKLATSTLAMGSAFLLSLLFSFLIVLDLPNLAKGARHLHDTRLQFVYDEVSDNVFHFGRVLGRALEAQLMIAILNTALTAVGLNFIFGLPNIAFLSAIVFMCSFIPVAGVFLSSAPICLVTLTAKQDVVWVLWVILFITIIHMIEAYILNPRIYGAHLKMNPVLVLSILVISHHLFGMWGLVLGVPVTTYVYKHVICGLRKPEETEAPTIAVPAAPK